MEQTFPVSTVDDAYNACYPDEALGANDERYVDLTDVRGHQNLALFISDRIRRTKPPLFHRQLVSGHRGSGKSTELRRLQARLEAEKYFAVYLDTEVVLDPGEIKYQDVLVAIAEAIVTALNKNDIPINQKLIEELKTWFDDRILTEEQKRDMEATLKGEASVEGKFIFAKVLASLTSQIKSGSSQKIEIRRRVEQELSGFIDRLNVLLLDARKGVIDKGYHDLVTLVDGLEKMQYRELPDGESSHSLLFVQHAAQLKAPDCHIVYTVPISLAFKASLDNSFPDAPFLLPMVDYQKETGRKCLAEVVEKRVNIETVFEQPESVERLIEMSGGSVRDLMRLIRMACDGARDKITPANVEAAVYSLINEFDRLLTDERITQLMRVVKERAISVDKETAPLLEFRMVHEYQNAKRWADLHPAVRANSRMQAALAEEERKFQP